MTDKLFDISAFMVPPSKPKMTKVSDESVMVTWDGPKTSGIPILFYKVMGFLFYTTLYFISFAVLSAVYFFVKLLLLLKYLYVQFNFNKTGQLYLGI